MNYIKKISGELYHTFYEEYEKAYNNSAYRIINFKEYIMNNYSWINDKNTQRLIYLANYSAGRDGILPKIEPTIRDKIFVFIFYMICFAIFGIIILSPKILLWLCEFIFNK